MNQRLNQSVIAATTEMFSSMLGWDVESQPPVEQAINEPAAEVSALISFVGNPSGVMALKCSLGFATRIASQMLGMDIAADSDDMKDAVGEFLNMIIGRAKTQYSIDEAFKISVPTLIIGEDYAVHISAKTSETVAALTFNYESDGMTIEVVLN